MALTCHCSRYLLSDAGETYVVRGTVHLVGQPCHPVEGWKVTGTGGRPPRTLEERIVELELIVAELRARKGKR